MPDTHVYGVCQACDSALTKTQYAVELQHHTIAYTLEGDTPNDQAYLEISSMAIAASFCSSACCKVHLPQVLAQNGIAPIHAQAKVMGGPIHPCAKCSAVVNMTQPHGAWVKMKREVEITDDGLNGYPEWFDVHAVICAACAGLEHATESVERARLQGVRL